MRTHAGACPNSLNDWNVWNGFNDWNVWNSWNDWNPGRRFGLSPLWFCSRFALR